MVRLGAPYNFLMGWAKAVSGIVEIRPGGSALLAGESGKRALFHFKAGHTAASQGFGVKRLAAHGDADAIHIANLHGKR